MGRYCRDILTGKIPAGKPVRLAIERHVRDLKFGPKRGLKFDAKAAAYTIEFFENFLFLDESTPFKLEGWQQFIIGSLFGWMGEDGYRRFRTAYVEVGKGNGKSPQAAGIGLFGLFADGEPQAEIYAAATKKDQAKILFRDAENMWSYSPHLRARIEKHVNNLSVHSTASFFRPISSETRGLDGPRVHMGLIDEIHEHPNDIVVNKMRAGTKSRKQALIFEITNSGYDRHSVCFQHHDYSLKILKSVLEDDSWFAYVCQLDPCAKCEDEGKVSPACNKCDQWTDEKVWIKANPNLGVSIKLKYLREQVREAQGMPAKENIVKRLNFCMWTESSVRWMPMNAWDMCGRERIDPAELQGQRCYVALDLSSVNDLTSAGFIFPDFGNVVLSFNWIPQDNMQERIKRDRVPYDQWIKAGLLKATPGNVVDYNFIRKDIQELGKRFDIQEIAYDPFNATQLCGDLQNEDGFQMVVVRQGMLELGPATKSFEIKVKHEEIKHGGNPLLRWAISNVTTIQDASGNYRPDKERSLEKIDPIVALIMASGRADAHGESGGKSIYESRGVLMI